MRLWSLHPRYLDSRGLVALWREGLLAQAVLNGQTKGYRNHPQLERFRNCDSPVGELADYLHVVHKESVRRGYVFAEEKINEARGAGSIPVTRGQIDYEWAHLCRKLVERDRQWLYQIQQVLRRSANPVFRVVPGDVEGWERRRSDA